MHQFLIPAVIMSESQNGKQAWCDNAKVILNGRVVHWILNMLVAPVFGLMLVLHGNGNC